MHLRLDAPIEPDKPSFMSNLSTIYKMSTNFVTNSSNRDNMESRNEINDSNNNESNKNDQKQCNKENKNEKNTSPVRTFRCITYGCPSSMCERLADRMAGYVTSVVLHDDIISRITPQSIR